ncbi:uncharacterized protein C17orf78 homolog isoform X2 [Mauremys mutica]|uniref:uncharacterized protein C17orf78 homolog isoform X2 n=1 Tax=Mauremys mutica TaxID=74926 RepID=UPI001D15ECE8|nr:uncharacterized protein C17orf78 homolog isoform X2 [Mauremys mutica]
MHVSIMDTILVFSLLFIYYSLSPKDLRDYDCHVENSSEVLSERTRSMSILLQESEKAVAKGELSRNHTVATLQCSGLHSSIQVNLLYSEKMYNVFTNKTNVKYTLQSLKVITDPDESVSTAHRCLLLTDHKQSFQTEFNLTGKVFLVGLSNCIINAKLSEPEIFAEQLHATEVHRQNSSSGIGEDMLLRLTRRQSIYVKAVIICVLLPCSLAFIVFVIFEVPFPCPCPGWSQQCNCIQKCKRQGEERTENPNSASSEGSVMVGHKKRGASEQAPWSKAAKIIAIHET